MLAISPANVLITTWFPKILAQAISKVALSICAFFFRILRCMLSFVIGYNAWTGYLVPLALPGCCTTADSLAGGQVHGASVLMAWVEQAEAEILREEFWKQVIVSSLRNLPDTGIELKSHGVRFVLLSYSMAIRQQPTMSATTHSFPISFTDPCSKLHNHMWF